MSFIHHQQQELLWLSSTLLDSCGGIRHGFSTRKGGVSQGHLASLNLRGSTSSGDAPENVPENYRRFCNALGVDVRKAVLPHQTHSTNIRRVTAADAGKGLWRELDYRDVDGLITNESGLVLTVFSADCGTVLLYDPVHRAVGAVHAGWRGCAAGILPKTIAAMQAAFGSRPEDLLAALGPCIGQCCFETDSDVPEAMRAALGPAAEPYITWQEPKFHVDLAGLNRQWLLQAGLHPAHIDLCELCSACLPDLFWSHRKMGSARGTQASMIALS